jgi:Asp-tRNA(Asn)/Glu-tRNA(Gln) amidotransferase A subunit family amidase
MFARYARIVLHPHIGSIFVHLFPLPSILQTCHALEAAYPDPHSRPPLYGIPFSIKDSIDLCGMPTTAACPALSYIPTASSTIVATLVSLGAIPIGKTDLDQLATGLTRCRSLHGIPLIPFSAHHIPGGSSSGSCVSVSSSLVSFSIGTDTAGSGRVPAEFNGIVGFKPTKGTVSTLSGVVPACESLDSIAFATGTVEDARTLWRLCRGFDAADRWAKHLYPIPQHTQVQRRFRFAIPPKQKLGVCSEPYRRLFSDAVARRQHFWWGYADIGASRVGRF